MIIIIIIIITTAIIIIIIIILITISQVLGFLAFQLYSIMNLLLEYQNLLSELMIKCFIENCVDKQIR